MKGVLRTALMGIESLCPVEKVMTILPTSKRSLLASTLAVLINVPRSSRFGENTTTNEAFSWMIYGRILRYSYYKLKF